MDVRVDKARQDALSLRVDHLGVRSQVLLHLRAAAHSQDLIAPDRHRLRDLIALVHCEYPSVLDDDVRQDLFHMKIPPMMLSTPVNFPSIKLPAAAAFQMLSGVRLPGG